KIRGRDDLEMVGEELVQPLLVEHERDLVDGGSVGGTDHAADGHVAQQRDLLLQVAADRTVRAAYDGIRLQTEGTKLLHRVLRRLGLQLAGGSDDRHQGNVDEGTMLAPHLVPELPDGLEEGERLDVPYGAADLDDLEVGLFRLGEGPNPRLDLVGDMRDHLDGLAEVIATALLREHRRVDRAGREVRASVKIRIEEPLVVPEVEIGLGSVVQDEDLAVLEGVHRPRIDVDVRVELLEHDLESARREKSAEGGGRDALAESGGDTTRDEDVLRSLPHHGTRLEQRLACRRVRCVENFIDRRLRGPIFSLKGPPGWNGPPPPAAPRRATRPPPRPPD